MSVKEPECKGCNGIFGRVVKDGMCSHCYHQGEEEAYVADEIQYEIEREEAANKEIEDSLADWPEDHDEREE